MCWVYEDREDFLANLEPYVLDGLAQNHRIALFLQAEDLLGARERVVSAIPDAADAVAREQIVFVPVDDAYLPDGLWDPSARLVSFAEQAAEAIHRGFAGLRAVADVTDISSMPRVREGWVTYEVRADLLVSRLPMIGVCVFDGRRSRTDDLQHAEAVHPLMLGRRPRPPVTIAVDPDGSLTLNGDVDFLTSPLVGSIPSAIATDLREPTLDLSGVRFVDAAGMRAIIQAARAIADAHQTVRLRGARPMFTRLWDLLGCDQRVHVEFEPA